MERMRVRVRLRLMVRAGMNTRVFVPLTSCTFHLQCALPEHRSVYLAVQCVCVAIYVCCRLGVLLCVTVGVSQGVSLYGIVCVAVYVCVPL